MYWWTAAHLHNWDHNWQGESFQRMFNHKTPHWCKSQSNFLYMNRAWLYVKLLFHFNELFLIYNMSSHYQRETENSFSVIKQVWGLRKWWPLQVANIRTRKAYCVFMWKTLMIILLFILMDRKNGFQNFNFA